MQHRSLVIYRPPVGDPKPLLEVLEYGAHRISAQVKNRQLEHFGTVMVERGSGTLRTALGGAQVVVAPAIFWLWPGETHSYGPDPGTTWDERWALFDGRIVDEILDGALITPGQPLLQLHDLGNMQRLFGLLRADMAEDTPLAGASAGARLQRIALTATQQAQVKPNYRTEYPIAPVIEALRQRAFGEVELVGFASEFGMSPATLRRKFLAATGLPPKAFQLRLRVDRAKEMLALTATGIEAIANQIGFDDPFYFSRIFAQREGISPRAFRERHKRS